MVAKQTAKKIIFETSKIIQRNPPWLDLTIHSNIQQLLQIIKKKSYTKMNKIQPYNINS